MTRSLIIGASGGIGAAMTRALTARGDDVTTLSRSAGALPGIHAAPLTASKD